MFIHVFRLLETLQELQEWYFIDDDDFNDVAAVNEPSLKNGNNIEVLSTQVLSLTACGYWVWASISQCRFSGAQ